MSAQAAQFRDWASEADYPLSAAKGLPPSTLLDLRGFTRIPSSGPVSLSSLVLAGDSLTASFAIPTATGIGTIHLDCVANIAGLRSGAETEVTAFASYESPWLPSHGFLLAGISATFGPGVLDMGFPAFPIPVEPALLADISSSGFYRLQVRRITGASPVTPGATDSLCDIGGDVTLRDGYNMSILPDPAGNRLLFVPDRGAGEGIHLTGWPSGADGGTCAGIVRTICGVPPGTAGEMEFSGEGGIEVLPGPANHTLTLRISRVSQSGRKC